MKERDAEINRLLGDLRRCQTQLLGPQVVQNDNSGTPLNGHPSIKMTRLPWSPYIGGNPEIWPPLYNGKANDARYREVPLCVIRKSQSHRLQ